MAKRDYVRGGFHTSLAKEINRVFVECENAGIFLNKKEASAVVAEKSKRGRMSLIEIQEYIKRIKRSFSDVK